MNFNYINLNSNLDSIINDFSRPNSVCSRIAISALPLINLHQKGATVSFVLMSGVQIYTNSSDLIRSLLDKNYGAAKQKVYRLCWLTASISLAVLMPNIQTVFSTGYFCVKSLGTFSDQIKNKEFQAAFFTFLEITNEILHLASIYDGELALLVISLLSKTIVEFSHAYINHYKNGKTIEAVANCLMGIVRGYSAFLHSKSLYRNYYGQELTNEILQGILRDPKNLDLDEVLAKMGISSYVKGVNFSKHRLTGMKFKQMKFINCDFTRCTFKQSVFENVRISDSLLIKATFIDSIVKNFFFSSCDFYHFAMIGSQINQTKFSCSSLNDSCWNDSVLKDVCFERSSLNFSHFFNAKAISCKLKEMTGLINCYLFEAKNGFKVEGLAPSEELPVVAMDWNFEFNGWLAPLIHEALEDNNVFSMRVDCLQPNIDIPKLQKEVKEAISNASSFTTSIPKEILNQAAIDSEIEKIKVIASKIIDQSDALSIPGGADIEPEFYGEERALETYTNQTYLRSIFEFCLISEAIKQKKPIMGTCRGSQIINVFLGGTLKQHVDGHGGELQEVKIATDSILAEEFKERLGESFIGKSMHHQAADKMGKNLKVIYEYDGVTKLYTSEDGLILGSQIHPEFYIQYPDLEKNREIYLIFKERINQSLIA